MYMFDWPPTITVSHGMKESTIGVRLTAVGDPEPGTVATLLWALGHIGWNVVPSLAKERGTMISQSTEQQV
jgi:hypothetical protein